jgi:hypothetical protein
LKDDLKGLISRVSDSTTTDSSRPIVEWENPAPAPEPVLAKRPTPQRGANVQIVQAVRRVGPAELEKEREFLKNQRS